MPTLELLLQETGLAAYGNLAPGLTVDRVTDDSRQCGPETLFVAVPGTKLDGHDFLDDAARRGSRVALISRREQRAPEGMSLLWVENPRRALALVAQHLAGNPSRAMQVIGITGTNGKTTVTYLLEAIFREAGLRPGVLGTIAYRWDGRSVPAPQTTPSPVELADSLAQMRAAGVQAVAMEVSSHAIDQHRVDGIHFRAAGLTNLTQDHLDYHGTMDAYAAAKERLFSELLAESPEATAVFNLDEQAGRDFRETSRAARNLGYSMYRAGAEFRVEEILLHDRGQTVLLQTPRGPLRFATPMFCLFNAVNCVTAAALAMALEIPNEAIIRGIAAMRGAPGRFELVEAGQKFPIIVDYAHTPDALQQVLLHARALARRRLIAVFGCGGDRDPGKRPLMGKAAVRIADHVIVTNDNPRTEEPARIAEAIIQGVREGLSGGVKFEMQLDRRAAIARAIRLAKPGDVVVIAGKGHEDYQIVGTAKSHFDDREEARAAVGALGA